ARAEGRSEHVPVEGAEGADSPGGAPDTFLPRGASASFGLDRTANCHHLYGTSLPADSAAAAAASSAVIRPPAPIQNDPLPTPILTFLRYIVRYIFWRCSCDFEDLGTLLMPKATPTVVEGPGNAYGTCFSIEAGGSGVPGLPGSVRVRDSSKAAKSGWPFF